MENDFAIVQPRRYNHPIQCLYMLRCECSLSLIGIWAIIHLSCGQFRRMVSHVLGVLGTGNLCKCFFYDMNGIFLVTSKVSQYLCNNTSMVCMCLPID